MHCDPTASHYLKLVLDSIYLPQGGEYRNEIIWKRHEGHSDAKRFGVTHDVILYYIKSRQTKFNKVFTDFSPQQLARYRPDKDGRLCTGQDLTAAGASAARTVEWRGVHPGTNRHWMWSIEEMERLLAEGRILLREDGKPRKDGYKVYLDEKVGKTVGDVWDDIGRIGNTAGERLGYPTQKPEALLERIIAASSNPGDVVLDAYCGCGTTVAVAQRMGRQWLGIDITYQSIALILRRLEAAFGSDAANLVKLNGVPRDMESATALALKKDDRTRKEFEKWAVLTYTRNRGRINEKKGADGGIDGEAFTRISASDNAKLILQIKSGHVGSGDIDALRGVMAKFDAAMAVFITLKNPSPQMIKDAAAAGIYKHPVMGRDYPRIKIVTVRAMLEEGATLDLPLPVEVLKTAARAKQPTQNALPIAPADFDPDA